MRGLVLYDTLFGNTRVIAEAIAGELGVPVKSVTEVQSSDLSGLDALVVGSPINGWRPSERMGQFLFSLRPDQLHGLSVATFDTRMNVFFHGDAAKKIAAGLERAGANPVGEPRWFLVKGKEGPLAEGELEKAKTWGRDLRKQLTGQS